MRPIPFRPASPRRLRGHDGEGAALAAAAICGVLAGVLALLAAVESITPMIHRQLTLAAVIVS